MSWLAMSRRPACTSADCAPDAPVPAAGFYEIFSAFKAAASAATLVSTAAPTVVPTAALAARASSESA